MALARFLAPLWLSAAALPAAAQSTPACPATELASVSQGDVRTHGEAFYSLLRNGGVAPEATAFVPVGTLESQPVAELALGAGERIESVEALRSWQVGPSVWSAYRHVRVLGDGTRQPERATLVWNTENGTREWRLLHAHVSRAVPLGSTLAVAEERASGPGVSAGVAARMVEFWKSWTDRDFAAVAGNYVRRDDTLVFLPWVPAPFESWEAFEAAAEGILESVERADFADKGVHTETEADGAMLTTGLFSADVVGADGASTVGDGRFTLVWIACEDGWRVSHEHLSSFAEADSAGDQGR